MIEENISDAGADGLHEWLMLQSLAREALQRLDDENKPDTPDKTDDK